MTSKILTLFTRTPLHVGAGASVGAIDQPIIRERHTGLPLIPGSSLKGSFADHWNHTLTDGKRTNGEAAWLFGSDDVRESQAAAGALLFSEARLLAFPVRSARGSYAWATSPLLLRRAARDGVFPNTTRETIQALAEPTDDRAQFNLGKLDLQVDTTAKVVLEEYTFTRSGDLPLGLGAALLNILPGDPVWSEIASRLVILSDGQLSFFARNACEVAQHVRIDDATGTAAKGGLFNQENVPSETLFYSIMHAEDSHLKSAAYQQSAFRNQTAQQALDTFAAKISEVGVFQFGGDASTGLGYCTARLA